MSRRQKGNNRNPIEESTTAKICTISSHDFTWCIPDFCSDMKIEIPKSDEFIFISNNIGGLGWRVATFIGEDD
jgi:hypothetical protein